MLLIDNTKILMLLLNRVSEWTLKRRRMPVVVTIVVMVVMVMPLGSLRVGRYAAVGIFKLLREFIVRLVRERVVHDNTSLFHLCQISGRTVEVTATGAFLAARGSTVVRTHIRR